MTNPLADHPCGEPGCAECAEKARGSLTGRVQDALARLRARRDALAVSWSPTARVAASVEIPRAMLADPDATHLVNGILAAQLVEHYPLRWRYTDARWALVNLARTARGRQPLALPYATEVETQVVTDDARAFERNTAVVLATVRRKPADPNRAATS